MSADDRRLQGIQGVQDVLSRMSPAEWLPFLAYAEQGAKRDGDLDLLRAIRHWRAANPTVPVRKGPPESA